MASRTLVSEDTYLHTSYEGDREFWDGELVVRNWGEVFHSELHTALIGYIGMRRKLWNIHAYPSVRTHVREGLYLLPDLSVYARPPESRGGVLTTPPLLWIEVLSPKDRSLRMNRKVRELLQFGVPYIWLIEPKTLESKLHTPHGSTPLTDGILRIPNTPIEVPLHALDEDYHDAISISTYGLAALDPWGSCRTHESGAVEKRVQLTYAKTMTSPHTLVSEEEYLHTSYQPDCEYWDGELVERNVGTFSHSDMQLAVGAFFRRRRKAWNISAFTDVRTLVRPGRYLLPDVMVFAGPRPEGQVATTPPLIWIEVLSPEDRPVRVTAKVREVLDFGVPYVWVIDPETLESALHTQQGTTILEDGILRIPNTPIEVPLRALDED